MIGPPLVVASTFSGPNDLKKKKKKVVASESVHHSRCRDTHPSADLALQLLRYYVTVDGAASLRS